MTTIAIVYHSGYGHTAKLADAVLDGAKKSGAQTHLLKADALTDADWDTLDKVDGIIFGAPTYMGSLSGPFKVFMDASSKKWGARAWANKVAGGFTNSASYSGDKQGSLLQLFTFAMQHGMVWAGVEDMPPQFSGTDVPSHDMVNRLGSFSGLMSQSNHGAGADIAPPAGDLETARRYGARIAGFAKKLKA